MRSLLVYWMGVMSDKIRRRIIVLITGLVIVFSGEALWRYQDPIALTMRGWVGSFYSSSQPVLASRSTQVILTRKVAETPLKPIVREDKVEIQKRSETSRSVVSSKRLSRLCQTSVYRGTKTCAKR